MPINPSDIPDQMKRLIDPKDRKGALGNLAPTAADVTAKSSHKHEKEMQETIKAWLDIRGWFYVWQPMHKRAILRIGTPDFIVCVPFRRGIGEPGLFVAVECKMPGGSLSNPQKQAAELILSTGGEYLIAYSAQQALEFLKGLSE